MVADRVWAPGWPRAGRAEAGEQLLSQGGGGGDLALSDKDRRPRAAALSKGA